ncbi:unnamed protein product [Mytilus coruscus]|uniref:Protein kinase domain-containing protein n=1 Tax=Mytilus coruscus TaxID=42192 RepID=A0A6J8EA79_MYTCO|nr:unnamed protein product [Mytilus coruscus]
MITETDLREVLHTQPIDIQERGLSDDLTELVKDLSPSSQARTILLLQSLRKNEAVIGVDDQKLRDQSYSTKMKDQGQFKSRLLQGRKGVYKNKRCAREGNSAGDIIVIKDKTTQTESAHKTMMISYFREEEIRAWVDLSETGIPPALYCFKLEGNRIHIFMEKIDNGITLRDIIDTHMGNIRAENSNLARPFSLYFFRGLLSAVHVMHQKGWTHRDLHPGNVMLQEFEGVIQTRIIDFGLAKPMDSEDGLRGFRSDIAEVVRKFTALYIDEEFDSENDFRKKLER